MEDYRIKRMEFVTSVATLSGYRELGLPEIAIAGKSNVGKSSLINALANNRKLAKTSSTPGKTRLINFFKVNDDFYLTDLPGYGFSRAGKERSQQWGPLIEGYLQDSERLIHMFFLVDIRHAPTVQDRMMCDWLLHFEIPFTLVATKSDKVARAHWQRQAKIIRETLGLDKAVNVLPFSVGDAQAKERLTRRLGEILTFYTE